MELTQKLQKKEITDFIPKSWNDDPNVIGVYFDHYTSNLLALATLNEDIWQQCSKIANSLNIKLNCVRISEQWEVPIQTSVFPIFQDGFVVHFNSDKRKFPPVDYLIVISPIYKDKDEVESISRIQIAIALLKCTIGEPVALKLATRSKYEIESGKSTYASEIFRIHTQYSEKIALEKNLPILLSELQFSTHLPLYRASSEFMIRAMNELDDNIRATLYCTAIETLNIGNKIIGSGVRIYSGIINEFDIKHKLKLKTINDIRNNFLHKGIRSKLGDDTERIIQFLYVDAIAFKETGEHLQLALQLANKIQGRD